MVCYDSRSLSAVSSPSAAFRVRAAGQPGFLAAAGNEPAAAAGPGKDGLLRDAPQRV